MNQKQRVVLMVALGVVVVMLLFPPYIYRTSSANINLGYSFILSPAVALNGRAGVVDIPMLLAQWVGVTLAAAIGFLVARD